MAEENKDRAEKDLDLANDCGWVRALDASEKSIRITKADLLSAMFQEKGNVLSNIDNYKETGIYGVNSADFPNGVISYGLLVVFSGLKISTAGGGYPICQILIQCYPNPPIIKCRTRWSETWSSWKSISIT